MHCKQVPTCQVGLKSQRFIVFGCTATGCDAQKPLMQPGVVWADCPVSREAVAT